MKVKTNGITPFGENDYVQENNRTKSILPNGIFKYYQILEVLSRVRMLVIWKGRGRNAVK